MWVEEDGLDTVDFKWFNRGVWERSLYLSVINMGVISLWSLTHFEIRMCALFCTYTLFRASLVAQMVKNPPAMRDLGSVLG